jgi:hypothetical protein
MKHRTCKRPMPSPSALDPIVVMVCGEVQGSIDGSPHDRGCAGDQGGQIINSLMQRRRDKADAYEKGQCCVYSASP